MLPHGVALTPMLNVTCLAKLGLKRSRYFLELMLLGHVLACALCVSGSSMPRPPSYAVRFLLRTRPSLSRVMFSASCASQCWLTLMSFSYGG